MRRSTVHLQWISMNLCPLEIVRSCYFRPLIIFSSSVSQMRPLLPNTCQNWVTMSRSSESLHGSLRVGRSLKRSSPVQSLSAADIAGEYQVHLFPCILSSPWGGEGAYYSSPLVIQMLLQTTRSPSTSITLILNELRRVGMHAPSLP